MLNSRMPREPDGQYRVYAVDANGVAFVVTKKGYEISARFAASSDSKHNANRIAWVEDSAHRIVAMYKDGARVGAFDERDA